MSSEEQTEQLESQDDVEEDERDNPQELQKRIDELMEANLFARRQADLLAAFVWRCQKADGDEPEGAFSKPVKVEMTTEEIAELEAKLDVTDRLRISLVEKELVRRELNELDSRAEKDIGTLKAVLEECRMRTAETKKDAYDFRRDIVMGAENSRSGRVNAEKVKKFTEEKLKAKGLLVRKYKTKNSALLAQIHKLQDQLKAKEEQDGDSLHSIDLEQLKIQNAQYNSKIQERNRELLKLKMTTGKTVQRLNEAKQDLGEQVKRSKALRSTISERKEAMKRMEGEITKVSKEIKQQAQLRNSLKNKSANADMPQIMDYVMQKKREEELQDKIKSWDRKLEIAQLGARRAKAYLKKIKQFDGAATI